MAASGRAGVGGKSGQADGNVSGTHRSLVIGGSGHLGRAVCATLAALGSRVAVTYATPEASPRGPGLVRLARGGFRAIGEPLRGLISPEAMRAELEGVGLYVLADTDPHDWAASFGGPKGRVIEGVLPESLLAAQARPDYNEALFRHAIALAALERVTGGAFCAGLASPAGPDNIGNSGPASPNN